MSPDLNSLPASTPPSSSASPLQNARRMSINSADATRPAPPSPRSPSLSSLQAAAAINAGLQRSPGSPSPVTTTVQRRSSLMNNLALSDPAVPPPSDPPQPTSVDSNSSSPRLGRHSLTYDTADPHHQRQPSFGEIHQQFENEQEAQVNRLLHMIRIQQDQIAQIQRSQNPQDASPTPTEQSRFPTPPTTQNASATPSAGVADHSSPRSASLSGFPPTYGNSTRPHSLSRQSSARLSTAGTNSRSSSPALRPTSSSLGPLTEDFLLGGTRDECAFYQAETQMLTRENQMLRQRIRELERQVADMAPPSSAARAQTLAQGSPLSTNPATFTSEAVSGIAAEVEPVAKVD